MIKFLYPHWIDRLTYATTMPENEQQQYLDRFFRPFHPIVWLMLIMVFISFIIFKLFDDNLSIMLSNQKQNDFIWSIIFRTLLRQPLPSMMITNKQQKKSKKFIFIIWLLATIILTSAYSGCLLSNIAIPKLNYIDSIWKLIDSMHTGKLLMIGTDNEFNFLKVKQKQN